MRIARAWAGLRRSARAFRGCAPQERAAFAEAWGLLLWYWLRWRTGALPVSLLRRRTVVGVQPRGPGARSGDAGARVLAVFARALRSHVVHPSCVPRSLALQRMLQRRGWAVRLRIGLRRSGGKVQGHAWLEGDVLAGRRGGRLVSFVPWEWSGSNG